MKDNQAAYGFVIRNIGDTSEWYEIQGVNKFPITEDMSSLYYAEACGVYNIDYSRHYKTPNK